MTAKLKPWLLAARPKTLPAAAAPVLIGTAMAWRDGGGHWPSAILAALCALLLQVAANYANDYFDYVKGTDTAERLGPTRATAAGWVTPAAMRRAFIIALALAGVMGAYLLVRGGLPAIIIGLLCVAAAILYTGGPFPLGYHGLGDLFVFIFFGLVGVGGTYYVQTLDINAAVLWAGVAPGLLSVAILTVNNLRDIDGDRSSGKRTLPARLGAAFGRAEYLLCLLIACIGIPLWLTVKYDAPMTIMLAAAALAAAGAPLRILLREAPSARYNLALAQTGRLLLVYGILFSIGLWL